MRAVITRVLVATVLFFRAAAGQTKFHIQEIVPAATGSTVTVGENRYYSKDGHFLGLAARDSMAADVTLRLPVQDAPGCLASDGARNLDFGPCGGANSLTISAARPMLLYAHFRHDDITHVYIEYSLDLGINWTTVRKEGSFHCTNPDGTEGECRDPSIAYIGGRWFILASPTAAASTKVQLWGSNDLQSFDGPSLFDMRTVVGGTAGSSVTNVFAPEWGRGPSSDPTGFWAAVSFDNTYHFTPYFVPYNIFTNTVGTGTAVTVTGTAQGSIFDLIPFYDPGCTGGTPGCGATTRPPKRYLFYVDQVTNGAPGSAGFDFRQGIAYATGSTLLGTYAQSANTPPNNFAAPGTAGYSDYFGFSKTSEAPNVIGFVNGLIRIFADTWLNVFDSTHNAPRKYLEQFVDSFSGTAAPFTAVAPYPAPIHIGSAEHGTMVSITDQAEANIVFQAAAHFRNDTYIMGSLVVGDATATPGVYTVLAKGRSLHDFLNFPEPVSYAAMGADGQAAVWTSCGDGVIDYNATPGTPNNTPNPWSCAPSLGGAARWVNSYQGRGGGGQVQFNNTRGDLAETSLAFLSGAYAYGALPLVANRMGTSSIWNLGTNNPFFGPAAGGLNLANNWFYLYNPGLGANAFTIPNAGFEAAGLSPWTAYSVTAATSTANPHSGTSELELTAGAGDVEQNIPGLLTGNLYVISAWMAAPAGTTAQAYLYADDGTGAGAVISASITPNQLPLLANEYQKITVYFTATSSGVVRIKLGRIAGSGTLYWDDVDVAIGSFPWGVDPVTGRERLNYGLTFGGGNNTSLEQSNYVSFDAPIPNVLNCGDGQRGTYNCNLLAGGVNLRSYFRLGGSDPANPNVEATSPSPNVIQFGDGITATVGAFNANLLAGSLNIRSDIRLGNPTNPAAPYIFFTTPSANVLSIGDGTGPNNNGILVTGIFDAQSVLRLNGTDATAGSGSSAKWRLGVDAGTNEVKGNNVVAVVSSYAVNFIGTHVNATDVTATGVIRSNTGFNVSGSGGVNTPITCHTIPVTVGATTYNLCDSINSHTFGGGIKTN